MIYLWPGIEYVVELASNFKTNHRYVQLMWLLEAARPKDSH
jgi:hypothetical protein